VITLPTIETGLHYRFVKTGIAAFASVLTPAAGGTPFQGHIINTNGTPTAVPITAGATVSFTGTSAIGDYIELHCDGTNWYVNGMSKVAAGLATA